MDVKKLNALRGASLFIIGIAATVLMGFRLPGLVLPDTAIRLLGSSIIIALPVLGFTSIQKNSSRQ